MFEPFLRESSVIGKSDRLWRETPFKAKPLRLLALGMLDRMSV
ncbi:hypothetical protein ACWATR_39465 [Nostoc sp. UIC 10890]